MKRRRQIDDIKDRHSDFGFSISSSCIEEKPHHVKQRILTDNTYYDGREIIIEQPKRRCCFCCSIRQKKRPSSVIYQPDLSYQNLVSDNDSHVTVVRRESFGRSESPNSILDDEIRT